MLAMIRMALVSIFTLISIASFIGTLYLLWITAFAVGWGGGGYQSLGIDLDVERISIACRGRWNCKCWTHCK